MSQNSAFQVQKDKKHGQILVGSITEQDIADAKFCSWFNRGKQAYMPDTNRINDLKAVLPNYRFVVFAGTWCEDTQYLLPKFFKVVHSCKLRADKIEMYGLDANKQGLNAETLLYKVVKVPTIIIINGHREVGRIVESLSQTNIETEILYLIEKDIESQSE